MDNYDELVINVNYALSLADMIKASGCRWADPKITEEKFSRSETNSVSLSVELLDFGPAVSTDVVLASMKKESNGESFRPATIHELLAFGAQYPNAQVPIVALGSECKLGSPYGYVPCLGTSLGGYGRQLRLFEGGGSWSYQFVFLAVRNK